MSDKNPDFCPAAEQVVRKYADMVYRIALSQTKQPHLADDVFQEVFLRYLKKQEQFSADQEDYLKHWLIRVTVNRCRSLFSGSWFQKTQPLEEALPFDEPELTEVYTAVLALPPKYRLVLHLHYFEGFSVAEIAAVLHVAEGTVKAQLSRGRNMLKAALECD